MICVVSQVDAAADAASRPGPDGGLRRVMHAQRAASVAGLRRHGRRPHAAVAIAIAEGCSRRGACPACASPGSTRESVRVSPPATHTPPSPAATAVGSRADAANDQDTAFVAGSIRDTVPSSRLMTHTAPSPHATALGPRPTAIARGRSCPVRASIRVTVPASSLATQTAPAPAAIAVGVEPTWIERLATCARSMRRTAPSTRRDDPQRPVADGDGPRARCRIDVAARPCSSRGRLAPRVALAVGDPQGPGAEGQPGRLAADVDRHATDASRIDPRHGPVEGVGDPHRAAAGDDAPPPWPTAYWFVIRRGRRVDHADVVRVDARESIGRVRRMTANASKPAATSTAAVAASAGPAATRRRGGGRAARRPRAADRAPGPASGSRRCRRRSSGPARHRSARPARARLTVGVERL